MKAVIIVAEGHEECEALCTYDLLFRAGIDVRTAGFAAEVTSSHNVTYKTMCLVDDIKDQLFDCLILPGGLPGTYNLEKSDIVQKMIENHVENGKLVAAICAAPSILLHKGYLKDHEFICSPGFESGFTPAPVKAIRTGNFITGKGLGAVNEFSYEIIKALDSEEKAQEIWKKICY